MKITCDHSASSYGIPVILDSEGFPLDYADGFKKTLKALGWTQEKCASMTNKSLNTIKSYSCGRAPIPADVLNVLSQEL